MHLRRAIYLFFVSSLFLSIPSQWKRVTYGFKVAKLQVELARSEEWEVQDLLSSQELLQILSQPFLFLGKGAQCYAFASGDNQYVLKLFRFDRLSSWEIATGKDRTKYPEKVHSFFTACKIGYTLAKEETGLVHLHLNQTDKSLPVLKAKLPNGRILRLPLDRYRFAIQKKAEPLQEILIHAKRMGKLKEKIDAIEVLVANRAAKGITNYDSNLWRNFGFLGERAIEIDFGNYAMPPDFSGEKARFKEWKRYALPLRAWVAKHAPECLAYLDEKMKRDDSA